MQHNETPLKVSSKPEETVMLENPFLLLPKELRAWIWNDLSTPSLLRMKRVSSFFQEGDYKEYLACRLQEFFRLKQKSFFLSDQDCLYLFNTGLVAALGNNQNGKLGLGNVQHAALATFIKSLSNETIIKVALGGMHSVFLNDKGQVWVCGNNKNGQLGLGNDVQRVNVPTQLSNLPFITDIACNLDYTLFKDKQGQVYFCGSNYMNLANLDNTPNVYTPIMINTDSLLSIMWRVDESTPEQQSSMNNTLAQEENDLMASFLQRSMSNDSSQMCVDRRFKF